MAENITFGIRLRADGKGFVGVVRTSDKELRKLTRTSDRAGKEAQQMSRSFNKAGISLQRLASVSIAGIGISSLAKSFIEAKAESESFAVRLRFLLGSIEEGNRLFEDMSHFAGKVPFEYREIMSAATQLAGVMKGGVDDINQWMPLIGDLAAITGLNIQTTTEQVIRMLSSGAASADLFRDRGITAMLGFKAGVSYSTDETRKILWNAWDNNESKFKGSTQELARTWYGTMSMLKDAWFQFQNQALSDESFDDVKLSIRDLASYIRDIDVRNAVNNFQTAATVIGGLLVARTVGPALTAIGTSALVAAGQVHTLGLRASATALAVRGLRVGMGALGGPLGIAILAGTAIYEFSRRASDASENTAALTGEIGDLKEEMNRLTKSQRAQMLLDYERNIDGLRNAAKKAQQAYEAVEDGLRTEIREKGSILAGTRTTYEVLVKVDDTEVEQLRISMLQAQEAVDTANKRAEAAHNYVAPNKKKTANEEGSIPAHLQKLLDAQKSVAQRLKDQWIAHNKEINAITNLGEEQKQQLLAAAQTNYTNQLHKHNEQIAQQKQDEYNAEIQLAVDYYDRVESIRRERNEERKRDFEAMQNHIQMAEEQAYQDRLSRLRGFLSDTHEEKVKKQRQEIDARYHFDSTIANYVKSINDVEVKSGWDKVHALRNIGNMIYEQSGSDATKNFELHKAFALSNATISIAAAITEALPNIPLAAAIGAFGGVQIATILKQQPPQAHGGLENVPQDATYMLKRGERVLAPRQNEALMQAVRDGNVVSASPTTITINNPPINITIKGGDNSVETAQMTSKAVATEIEKVTLKTIGDQLRPGGLLNRQDKV